MNKHHCFTLRLLLQHIDDIDAAITEIDQDVDITSSPFAQRSKIPSTIPGISQLSVEVIAAEIGFDMGCFPTQDHLIF
ncbi:MAG: hypothetical protein G3I10_10770 [Ferrovum sp.]|nr:hypothetical protein [Ferrovum sp.]